MKKKWFTETRNVDIETGEILSKSRIEREKWVYLQNDHETRDCGKYMLKIIYKQYEKNRQTELKF